MNITTETLVYVTGVAVITILFLLHMEKVRARFWLLGEIRRWTQEGNSRREARNNVISEWDLNSTHAAYLTRKHAGIYDRAAPSKFITKFSKAHFTRSGTQRSGAWKIWLRF